MSFLCPQLAASYLITSMNPVMEVPWPSPIGKLMWLDTDAGFRSETGPMGNAWSELPPSHRLSVRKVAHK